MKIIKTRSEEEQTAQHTLYKAHHTTNIWFIPKWRTLHLWYRCTDQQIGYLSRQKWNNEVDRPVVYWFKILSDGEQNLYTANEELLSIFRSIFILCPSLKGTTLTVWAEYQALKWVLPLADFTSKLSRWSWRLIEYAFCLGHWGGVKHQVFDLFYGLPM